ncbi:MAG TPA: winged helix-turn-helix domain-containing protein [Candidatus Angelobacter sp.]
MEEQHKVRFGLYTADLRSSELRKGQDTVPVQNLPFRILAILLREPGRVITRDELRQELWPANTFVDFERGISTAVSKLREALGDSATNPRFVETVGRRGYRFIAPVTRMDEVMTSPVDIGKGPATGSATATTTQKEEESIPPPSGLFLHRKLLFSVTALLAVFLIIAVYWVMPLPSPKVLRIVQLSTSGKAEHAGSLHTDGSRLYFLERDALGWTVMQTSLAGGEMVSVKMPFPDSYLLGISPDKTEMLFTTRVTEYLGKHALWITPIQGGTPKRVADLLVDRAAWFPDGRRLLCSNGEEVFSVDRDGSNRQHLFNVDGEPFAFNWKPDGSAFAFSVIPRDENVTLWTASADGTNVHLVLPGWNDPPGECCARWTPDGRNLIFRSSQGGQEDLWVLREPGSWIWKKKPILFRLTNGPTSFSEPLVSPDGKRIFALGLEPRSYVGRFDRQQNDFVRASLPELSFDLNFSPDGQWVAYISGPGLTLWRSHVDGSERLQLTSLPARALRPVWSRDSKQILFQSAPSKKVFSAYIVSVDGGSPKPVIENDDLFHDYADWSPDGQSIVEGLEPGTGNAGISLVNLKTHQISQVPGSQGMHFPRFTSDGHYLVTTSEDAKSIFTYDLQTKKWKQVGHANQLYKFVRSGESLYYQDIRDRDQAVFRLDPKTGKAERVGDFSKLLRGGVIRCSFEGFAPDGAMMISVFSSWANVYAFDVELP